MTAEPRIDPTVINELIDLGPETGLQLVKDLVEIFSSEAPLRLAAMRDGFAAHDLNAVGQAAHAMRGGAGNLGAIAVAALCNRIEQAAKARTPGVIAPMIAELEQELAHVQEALNARLAAME